MLRQAAGPGQRGSHARGARLDGARFFNAIYDHDTNWPSGFRPQQLGARFIAYARDENDEFVAPTQIGAPAFVRDGDSIIFMNFRADRARQITRAFVVGDFDKFDRGVVPAIAAYVQLTEYAADIPAPVAYPPQSLDNVFGEYMARLGKTQLRIAETEKYPHVTFFFNGGREQPYEGEERILVASPKATASVSRSASPTGPAMSALTP